jgi:hypothetical protein
LDFLLFLLVNATLFLRPGEIVPDLEGLPIYNYCIIAALVVAAPRIAEHLRPDRLRNEPVTVCVLGLVPAVMFSNLSHFDTWGARFYTWEFSKVVMYYLVLIAVVNSTKRLRTFVYTVAIFAGLNAGLAVLQYYEIIEVHSLTVLQETAIDEETGAVSVVPRLRATGIFNDPNDLAMIAVFGIAVSAFGLFDRRLGLSRLLWSGPLALFLITLFLTKSRGGLLAFAAAAATSSYFRFGLWKTVIAVAVILPSLALIAGRQSDVAGAMASGTGRERIELWSAGLVAMRGSPVFGIGSGKYEEECGLVAHNSFLHAFVELGLFGGSLFLGAFWFAGLALWKLGRQPLFRHVTSPTFRGLEPCVMTILCGAAVSLASLSRVYVTPTYLVLGTASAMGLEARRRGIPVLVPLTVRRLAELLVASIAFLAAIYLFIKVTSR